MDELKKYRLPLINFLDRYTINLSILLCIFLGFVVSLFFFITSPLFTLAVLVGGFIFFISIYKPEVGILIVVIILSSFVFERSLPLIPIPFGSFHVTDVILLSLLIVIPFKLFLDRSFRLVPTPLDAPLYLFYTAAIISVFRAVMFFGVDFNVVIRIFRIITYYLIFFVITNLLREKRQIKFVINGLFVVANIVGLSMIIQAIVGRSIRLLPGGLHAVGLFASRIIPPGTTLIYIAFITAVCTIVFINRPILKSIHFYILPVIGTGILLTYFRSYWVAIIFSLSIFMVLISKRSKKRYIACLLIAVILMSIFSFTLLSIGGRPKEQLISIFDRFTSLFTGKKIFHMETLNWRWIENKFALRQIVKHPLLGIGLGNDFRARTSYRAGALDPVVQYSSWWLHNAYLWILMKMGLIGFLTFLWFYIRFLMRGFSNWKKIKDVTLKSAVTGFMLSGVGIMLIVSIEPLFMMWDSIIVIATIIGLTEAIIKINKDELTRQN